jgi:hypothetical protein
MENIDNELDTIWEQAEVTENTDFSPIPDGKYNAKVEKCQYTHTKETGLPMIAWEFIIAGEVQNGRHVFLNRVLRKDNPDSIKFVKNDFARVGLRPKFLSELVPMMGEMLDKVVEIQLKTKTGNDNQQHQNCYINKLAAGSDLGEEVPMVW